MRYLIPVIAALVVLSGCHAKASAPGEAPTGVTATQGDGLVVMKWDVLPDLTYWIFFQAGDTVDVASPNSTVIRRAVAPRVVSGLTNGTTYAFAMNATHNDSSAGPSSTPVLKAPALAGASWFAGTPLPLGGPPANLRDIALSGSRFVVVGDATTTAGVTTSTIFAGDFDYTEGLFNFVPGNPQGVAAWMPPVTLPLNFTLDLSSVIFAPGTYVALSPAGPVIVSADGLNWTQPGSVPANGLSAIAFGFVGQVTATYVVVGAGGAIYLNSGGNLQTWVPQNSTTVSDLNGIFSLNIGFVVTGAGGTLLTSADGQAWSLVTTGTTNTLRGVAFCAACALGAIRYVAVGDAGTVVTSSDGVNWNPAITLAGAPNLRGVTVGGSSGTRFLAVGQGGAVAYSDDGIVWTAASSGSSDLAKVLYTGGLYLGVGDAGANAVSR
ncbi:MAG TPA: hypothetical protein VFK92_10775 [Burkholderiales bacterium]|nr:hypothetical protein [Burkholderiales bacterium]